jgi:hypothetical protein
MSPPTEELLAIISTLHAGERNNAREQFRKLWEILDMDDHFHRCVLAHYMADAQDDAEAELHWDRIAIEMAMAASSSAFDNRFPGMTLASFFPSLHLNLASSYEKLGRLNDAIEHAEMAQRAASALPDSPLGTMTAQAITRIRSRLISNAK